VYSRLATLVVTLFLVFSPFSMSSASAQFVMGCPDNAEASYACRVFLATSGQYDGLIHSFQAVKYVSGSEADAQLILEDHVETYSFLAEVDESVTLEFGNESSFMVGSFGASELYSLVFREGELVIGWTVMGEAQDFLEFFEEIYESVYPDPSELDNIEFLLPDLNDLPNGFEITEETFFGLEDQQSTDDEEPTKVELEATIEALEGQLDEQESDETNTSSNPSGSSAPRSSGPVEILDVTSSDAGVGDGSRYVYVDVRNITNRTLDYVQVDVTCRDSGGRVVATGIGNTLNLGTAQSTVITAIVLSAPTCDSVDVEVNPLTGGF
jgi:hypothetical protein